MEERIQTKIKQQNKENISLHMKIKDQQDDKKKID